MIKKMLTIVSAALLVLLLLPAIPTKAAEALDEIKSYVITVDMRQDGTMDIKYHLDWTVLNDTAEGPLTWVKIGIPNKHVDDIKALSANIYNIAYHSDDGSYVRVDFDRPYYAGETVSFDFSIHQSYMYTLDGNISYSFTPGWFDGIRVDSLKVLWNKAYVTSSTAMGTEGEYLTWETLLDAGERYEVKVVYPMGAFVTSNSMQAQEDGGIGDVLSVILVGAIVLIAIFGTINRYRGGFGGGGMHGHTYHHSCACAGCACACACACAGGGRAGCSAKNFYGAGVKLHMLQDKLK